MCVSQTCLLIKRAKQAIVKCEDELWNFLVRGLTDVARCTCFLKKTSERDFGDMEEACARYESLQGLDWYLGPKHITMLIEARNRSEEGSPLLMTLLRRLNQQDLSRSKESRSLKLTSHERVTNWLNI